VEVSFDNDIYHIYYDFPEGLPKDLFSGKDFRYEKTADGFTLRCRGKDLDKNETYQYEFKVK